jgi:hypothetical protein
MATAPSAPVHPEPVEHADLASLATRLTGELHFDRTMRTLYATDASEYQELPVAVALPKTEADIRELIAFANAARHRPHPAHRRHLPSRPGGWTRHRR